MQKLFKWLDDNILSVLAGFLLIFIPLYPKLPLVDILPGYIVRVRLEDFFVSLTFLIWIIWVFRGKTRLRDNPLFKPISAYLIVGILSMLSAIFIIHTVPIQAIHIQKMILHYLRRIEYFSLFFVFYSSVKSIKTVKIYLFLFLMTVLCVALYGFGQRYLYWPAFSTMNREFSKGWMLYLTSHARVLSTFGGHYDLAAFTMMALVLLWSVFFGLRRLIFKIIVFIVIGAAFWTLILTASRASFLAYLPGVTLMLFFWSFRKGLGWFLSRWFIVIALSILIMLSFGDLSERFTKLLRIDERLSGIKSLIMLPITAPPSEKAYFLENNPDAALAAITAKSDQPPSPSHPSDVYQDIPLNNYSGTDSASIAAVKRTYSKNAFVYDLSTAIRLDALWPMAIAGFKRNPLLGSGYSTLNKTQVNDFTEAESTDNDYLRNLGETGIFGFITFYGTLLMLIYIIWRNLSILRDNTLFSMAAGLAGLLFGLLVNATYIDVFESSKVAFTFWGVTGLVMAGVGIARHERKEIPHPVIPDIGAFINNSKTKLLNFIKSDFFIILLIIILAFILRLYKINTPLADWHSWRQADTSSVTRNYVKNGINILYPTYDDLSNIASGKDNPKGLRFVEFPLYNIASVIIDKIFVGFNLEVSGRLTSIFATLGSIVFLYLLVKKYLGKTEAIISGFLYAVSPYNIFYTRMILPEPFLVFTTLGMLYFTDRFVEKLSGIEVTKLSKIKEGIKILIFFILSVLFTISALLVKPYAIFLFLPLLYIWYKGFGITVKSLFSVGLFYLICLLPLVWWRWWIGNYPEGVPANSWLLNGDGIRFKGAFFYWIFADRLVRMILGYWGLPLFLLGIIAPLKKYKLIFHYWGIAILLYLFVFATGNVRHDYYQTLTIPIIIIFMARGVTLLIQLSKVYLSKWAVYCFLIIIFIFTEMFGWYNIRDLYNINHPEIVQAGNFVETHTHDHALVIAPYNGDTAFLYQTKRAGWPIMQDTIDNMIKKGAQYYVSVNFDETTKQLISEAMVKDEAKRRFKIIELNNQFVLIQLVPDRLLSK